MKTDTPYEWLEERFDPEYAKCKSLEKLIQNKWDAGQVIDRLCEWKYNGGRDYWLSLYILLSGCSDITVESWTKK